MSLDEEKQGLMTSLGKEDYSSIGESGKAPHQASMDGGRRYRSLTMSQRLSFNKVIESLSLSWHHINVYAPGEKKGLFGKPEVYGKQLLHDVSGVVQPGTLLAIMGASGAGKTTLLNVLTYRNRGNLCVEGDVRVNGGEIGKGMASMSAYIQQEDIFIGTLKVKEHLWFQAQLRMDKDVPYELRQSRIEAVMKEMSLAKCADVMIGIPGKLKGISGGEKKRLAVASEVLTNPPLMFCDEPTSGLDSFMAQNIVQTLQRMATKGRTIMCTIHQPSSEVFSLFDRVLLVADGRAAYLGPATEALDFFASSGYPSPRNYNPADHYIQTLAVVPGKEYECRQQIQGICDKFARSDHARVLTKQLIANEQSDGMYDELAFADKSPYKASWGKQFLAVVWRSWLGVSREPGVFKTRLAQALILSTIFGLTYFQQTVDQAGVMNINGALFLMQTQMTYGFVFSVINAFPPEFPVFLREHHDGMYRVDVYFLSKTVAEMVQFITIPVVFGTIMYWMVGLYPSWDAFLICVLTLLLVCNVSVSFGYVLSCSSSNVAFVLALGPIFVVPFMMIGGYYINSDSIPVYLVWMKYVSWYTYANRILIVNQWSQIGNISCDASQVVEITRGNETFLLPDTSGPCYHSGSDVIKSTGNEGVNIWENVGLLLVLLVGYRLLAFIILSFRSKRNYKLSKPKPSNTSYHAEQGSVSALQKSAAQYFKEGEGVFQG